MSFLVNFRPQGASGRTARLTDDCRVSLASPRAGVPGAERCLSSPGPHSPPRRTLVPQRSRQRWTPKTRATRRIVPKVPHGRSTDPRPFFGRALDLELDPRSIVPALWRDVCLCASLPRESRRSATGLCAHAPARQREDGPPDLGRSDRFGLDQSPNLSLRPKHTLLLIHD
jgi:hypothetical protein